MFYNEKVKSSARYLQIFSFSKNLPCKAGVYSPPSELSLDHNSAKANWLNW